MDKSGLSRLTDREREILRLVMQGLQSKQIAKALQPPLSPHTVDDHLRSAIRKLEASNRAHAAAILAEHEGIIKIEPPQSDSLASTATTGQPSIPSEGRRRSALLLSIGGREHDFDKVRTGLSIVHAALFGLLGLTVLVLVATALLWAFK